MSFNQSLEAIRKSRDLTVEEVADSIGITVATYNKYEQGTSVPKLEVVIKLADLFGVSLDDLVGRLFAYPVEEDTCTECEECSCKEGDCECETEESEPCISIDEYNKLNNDYQALVNEHLALVDKYANTYQAYVSTIPNLLSVICQMLPENSVVIFDPTDNLDINTDIDSVDIVIDLFGKCTTFSVPVSKKYLFNNKKYLYNTNPDTYAQGHPFIQSAELSSIDLNDIIYSLMEKYNFKLKRRFFHK